MPTPPHAPKIDPLDRLEAAIRKVQQRQIGLLPTKATALQNTGERVKLAADRLGAVIIDVEMSEGHYGAVTYSNRQVRLNKNLVGDDRILILAHELAHLLQPRLEVHGGEEMFAEAVAYLVGNYEEADYTEQAARYASQFKTSLPVLRLYREEIYFAAAFIIGER